MGVLGSGQYSYKTKKIHLEDVVQLDLRWLLQYDLLDGTFPIQPLWGPASQASVEVRASLDVVQTRSQPRDPTTEAPDVRHPIMVHWTPSRTGGMRPWLCCPSCHRQVLVLYGPGAALQCRVCAHMTYRSQGFQAL